MAQILDIVTTAAILYAVAAGLLIVFGVMKIINFAHGAFLTIGGYSALIVTRLGWNPWWSLAFAVGIGVVCGAIVERLVMRPLYARPLDAILATWGLGIVVGQLITLQFGREVQFVQSPVSGAMAILGESYSEYRLILVILAVILAVAMGLVLNGTKLGLQTRAVIMNENLARGLGINSGLVRFATFSIGSGLAALAGALITPLSTWIQLGRAVARERLHAGAGVRILVSLAVSCLVLGGAGAGQPIQRSGGGRPHHRSAHRADPALPSPGIRA